MHKLFLSVGLFLFATFNLIIFSNTASAISNGPVIYQVQTQGSSVAGQEYVSIKNLSSQDVDVTNWCVSYASSTDVTQTTLACLTPPNAQTKLWLPSGSYFTFASTEFVSVHSGYVPQKIFTSGIAATGGHIKLKDSAGVVVDKLGWGTAVSPETTVAPAHTAGKTLQRIGGDTDNNSLDFAQATLTSIPAESIYEQYIPIDVCPNVDGIQANMPTGYLADSSGNCQLDICINIAGLQTAIPDGYESLDGQNCTLIPLENAVILITELLPNVTSTDTGKEYIEIYNPNDHSINLKGYKLELGPSFTKTYTFLDQTLGSGAYASFSDAQTGIVLPNTTSSVRLRTAAGNIVSETAMYDSPSDDMAWASIDNVWQYTNRPTPSSTNEPSLVGGSGSDDSISTLAACPEGKYRNPETNRCRNVETEVGLKACAVDQVRNPDTNRCRSIFTSTSGVTSCKVGQTRNPETNRCRGTTAASSVLKACAANQERNSETNRCRKKATSAVAANEVKDIESEVQAEHGGWFLASTAGIGLAGYGVAEWRDEIALLGRKLGALLGKSPPTP